MRCSAKVLRVDGTELDVANAARRSYNKQKEEFEDSDVRILHRMLDERHTSPFEQVGILWELEMPLFVARQFMRHRMFRYNEISRRYTDESIEFFEFHTARVDDEKDKQGSLCVVSNDPREKLFLEAIKEVSIYLGDKFRTLRGAGIAKELARAILPLHTMTIMTVHTDLHNLMRYLWLRLDRHTQPEHRELARLMQYEASKHFPNIMAHSEDLRQVDIRLRKCLAVCRRKKLSLDRLMIYLECFE